jgi:hypothetical protein
MRICFVFFDFDFFFFVIIFHNCGGFMKLSKNPAVRTLRTLGIKLTYEMIVLLCLLCEFF